MLVADHGLVMGQAATSGPITYLLMGKTGSSPLLPRKRPPE
jgi:hypothetical protein